MLTVSGVGKSYPSPQGEIAVLSDVSLSFAPGDAAAIMGPSGSGKSTLLYILGALEPPTTGAVTIDGTNPFGLSAKDLAAFRNKAHRLRVSGSLPSAAVQRHRERARADAGGLGRCRPATRTRASSSIRSGSRIVPPIIRPSCRAARSSVSRSRARSSGVPDCCCATSRPAISIARRPSRSPRCCSTCSRSSRPF